VVFELESIDRMYLNLYVPQLQRVEGVLGSSMATWGAHICQSSAQPELARRGVGRIVEHG
jgi:hypothetical protein